MISKTVVLVIAPLVLIPVSQQHGLLSANAAPGIAREADQSAPTRPQDAARLAQREKPVDPDTQAGTRNRPINTDEQAGTRYRNENPGGAAYKKAKRKKRR